MNFVENMSLKNDTYHEGAKSKNFIYFEYFKRQQKMKNNFIQIIL